MKLSLLAAFVLVVFGGNAEAATLLWNFTDDNATLDSGTPVDFSISSLSIGNSLGTVSDPVNSTSGSSGYTGASGTGNIGNAFRVGSIIVGASGSGFIEFTVTPGIGKTFDLTDLDFGIRSTSTGPAAYALRSSVDSYATDVFAGTITANSTWSYKDNSFTKFSSSTPGAAVTFRLYGYGGTGSPGSNTINGRFDDISISITAVPEPGAALFGGLGMLAFLRRRR